MDDEDVKYTRNTEVDDEVDDSLNVMLIIIIYIKKKQ